MANDRMKELLGIKKPGTTVSVWRGRPIDPEELMALAACGLSEAEIAAELGISKRELTRLCKYLPHLTDIIEQGRALGTAALRKKQVERALQGSDDMLKHLGKHMLGQHDRGDSSLAALTKHDAHALLRQAWEQLEQEMKIIPGEATAPHNKTVSDSERLIDNKQVSECEHIVENASAITVEN